MTLRDRLAKLELLSGGPSEWPSILADFGPEEQASILRNAIAEIGEDAPSTAELKAALAGLESELRAEGGTHNLGPTD